MVEIRTGRLLMRRWRPADRAPFAALNADPRVMEHFPYPLTRAESDALADRIESRFEAQGYGLWALEVPGGESFVGFTGLNPMPDGVPGEGGVEVGWRLARHAWGRGYASEAARAALAYAFDELGLGEVYSITAAANMRSQAVMRRIGLRLIDRFEHPALPETSPLRAHVRYGTGRESYDRDRRWTGHD